MKQLSPEPAPLAHAPHWRRARESFARAVAAVGSPAVIAAIACLTDALRRQIVRWLCPLEHIARKLLLAEAAELRRVEGFKAVSESFRTRVSAIRNPGAGAASFAPGFRVHRFAAPRNDSETGVQEEQRAACAAHSNQDKSRPETWDARFSFSLPRDRFAVPESRAPRIRALWGPSPGSPPPPPAAARRHPAVEDSAFRLARRFEALRRVLENPASHARRLLRLIIRALPRFPEAARNFAVSPARAAGFDPADPRLSIEAVGLALDAGFDLVDTS